MGKYLDLAKQAETRFKKLPSDAQALIRHCQEIGVSLVPTPEGKLKVCPVGAPSEELKDELRQHKEEIIALLNREPTPSVCSSLSLATEVFPEWRGLLIRSAHLGLSVWVVRNRQDGQDLARETGHSALLLDDVLAQVGKNPTEVRKALLPIMICAPV